MSDATPQKAEPEVSRTAKSAKQTQGRSPAYPFIPLSKALDRAMQLKEKEGFYAVPDESAIKAWGFGAKSSGGRQTIAALKHFGLLEYIPGAGDKRNVKLSDLARRILLDVRPDSPDKPALIKQAALTPPVHAALMALYSDGLPSDTTIQTWLVLNKDFNETGAKDLIAEFRETAEFAHLFQPADMSDRKAVSEQEPLPEPAVVGDMVQVEINGALQLSKPARVRAIQEHDGKSWVFVEGSDTGIPMEQILVQTKAAQAATPAPRLIEEKPRQSSLVVNPDEREWIRGPLSRDTSYRLIVSGDLGPKEIGKLIKLLKAQQAVLSDEDEEEGDD
jgi:hypothetical protein